MDISSVGCLAVWAFQESMVKQFGLFKCLEQFGHLKCWMSSRINMLSVSSRLGISSVGCLAEWTFQVLRGGGVKQIGRF